MTTTADRRAATANRLAAMASDEHITYVPNGQYQKLGARVWYGVNAYADGRSWSYWLAPECGSYAGDFMAWPPEPAI